MNYIEAYRNAESYDEYLEQLKDQTDDRIIDEEEAKTFYDELTFKYSE